MTLRKKQFALVPSEREKICLHEHTPHRGRIPGTGPRVCTMCGMEFESQEEVNKARAEVYRHFRTREILDWIDQRRGWPMKPQQASMTLYKIVQGEFVGMALPAGGGNWCPLVYLGKRLNIINEDGFYVLPATIERISYNGK